MGLTLFPDEALLVHCLQEHKIAVDGALQNDTLPCFKERNRYQKSNMITTSLEMCNFILEREKIIYNSKYFLKSIDTLLRGNWFSNKLLLLFFWFGQENILLHCISCNKSIRLLESVSGLNHRFPCPSGPSQSCICPNLSKTRLLLRFLPSNTLLTANGQLSPKVIPI